MIQNSGPANGSLNAFFFCFSHKSGGSRRLPVYSLLLDLGARPFRDEQGAEGSGMKSGVPFGDAQQERIFSKTSNAFLSDGTLYQFQLCGAMSLEFGAICEAAARCVTSAHSAWPACSSHFSPTITV